jgi:hypothetical protein
MESSKFELSSFELSMSALALGVLLPFQVFVGRERHQLLKDCWSLWTENLPVHPSFYWAFLAAGVILAEFALVWLARKARLVLLKRSWKQLQTDRYNPEMNHFARLMHRLVMAGLLMTIFGISLYQSTLGFFPEAEVFIRSLV